MNRWTGIGNLVKDPVLKQSGKGTPVTSFTLAINHGFGDKKETDYIDCVAWKEKAESLCKYMSKGKKIAVSGRLQKRKSEYNGEVKYYTEVVADEIEFLSPMGEKKDAGALNDRDREPADMDGDFEPLDDSSDMPF